MELVMIPDTPVPRRLPFFLALEEWLARRYPDRDFFFPWQVEPTVIIGRHQLLEQEVDTAFCRDNNIDLVRRKSGGGAVLADMNNIMFSYITTSDNVTGTFSEYTSMVANALRQLGLDASDNSRNDILIGDRKVSGNSYYHTKGRSIVHGTMLYDFDPVKMTGALTPPAVKLKSHGVGSVRSRITTIREHLPSLPLAEFRDHIVRSLTDGSPLSLSSADIAEVEKIELEYRSPDWLTGMDPAASLTATHRIDGAGTFTVHLKVNGGMVKDFSLTGDYLSTVDDASRLIAESLRDVPYSRHHIAEALDRLSLERIIPGLTNQEFINLIC